MIIIGLEHCKDCRDYYKLHSDYTYIELMKSKSQKSSPKILEIKKALGKLNFEMKFPILLTEDLKTLIPRKQLMQELKSVQAKGGGCKKCGDR